MSKAKQANSVEYDKDIDSLHIVANNKKEILGTVVIGNFICDVDQNGAIVGIEIDNASEALEIAPNVLAQVKNARLEVSTRNQTIMIRFVLLLENKQIVGYCAVPQEKIMLTC